MSAKFKNLIVYSFYITIPVLCVFFCRFYKLAQGERTEEYVFGILLGILFDLIYSLFLFLLSKKSTLNRRIHGIILIIILSLITYFIILFFLNNLSYIQH